MHSKVIALSTLALVAALGAPASQAQTCDDYFNASKDLAQVVKTALDAITAKNTSAQLAALPAAEAALNKLAAAEVKAEVCNGNHINAYTPAQFIELSTLRAKGLDNGFPANLPIVKQPNLNQGALAYVVGWIKFEQGNFNAALPAYDKGLTMFPHDHNLQQEYLATLIRLQRYKDVVIYADKILGNTFDYDDDTRAKIYFAKGIAFFSDNKLDEAKDSLTAASRYNLTDDIQNYLDQVDDALAKKKKN